MGECPEEALPRQTIADRVFDSVIPLMHFKILKATAYNLLQTKDDVYKYETEGSNDVRENDIRLDKSGDI